MNKKIDAWALIKTIKMNGSIQIDDLTNAKVLWII